MTVTLLIVIVTCITSFMAFNNHNLFNQMKHYPIAEKRNGEWYRFITSGFIHGSWFHLGINMFVLYEFGKYVEQYFLGAFGTTLGRVVYLLVYLLTIIIADFPSYIKHKDNPGYAAIGASGGVSGILFIFILLAPWSMLGLYFIIPVPAIIFGVLYLIYSSWASKNQNDMIGHDAHFYGAVAGMVLACVLIPSTLPSFLNNLIDQFPF